MTQYTTESQKPIYPLHKATLIIFADAPILSNYEIVQCDDGEYFSINEDTITFWTSKGMLIFLKYGISGFEIQVHDND